MEICFNGQFLQRLRTCNIRPPTTYRKGFQLQNPNMFNERNMTIAHLSLFPTLTTLSIKVVALYTKVDIKAKARTHVENFIMASSNELLTPPLEVKMRRLYVLLSKIDVIMNRTIMEIFEMTMFLQMKMEMNGTLGGAFMSTFEQWYLFPPISTFFVHKFFFFLICVCSFSMIYY
jgi:hypothetical protein